MMLILQIAGGILLASVGSLVTVCLIILPFIPFFMFDSPYGYWGRWRQLLKRHWGGKE